MRQQNNRKKKAATRTAKHSPRWFSRRSVIAIFIVAVAATGVVVTFEVSGLLTGHKAPTPGWIIDSSQLQSLVDYAPSSLPKTYFDTHNTVVLKSGTGSDTFVPSGWSSQHGNHYTSYVSKSCGTDCFSLTRDLAADSSSLKQQKQKPVALLDDEHWPQTPASEQTNPCGAMSAFVQTAHRHGLTTILAPDQDLAQPGVITSYQGGESENWQTYLRLGLASCAAKSGTEWYHVMSQPFEAHWCGNPLGKCQSSESDFVNFVTQAALQAKAVNPAIKISDGLSTSPQYFGYFRGAETFAKVMYRDYTDVRHTVNAVWMNIIGRNGNTTTLYFLSMLGKNAPSARRSSVLFLQGNGTLETRQPSAGGAHSLALSNKGTSLTFATNQILKSGTSLPAGTGEFQFWTDGASNKSAKLGINFGYCSGNSCEHRRVIRSLSFWVHGNEKGAVTPGGAFTTRSNVTLPTKGGPYHLYARVVVESGSPFNLLYGSANTATNLATPVLLQL
ncbi:MAG TPA: hypothetical protein VGG13_01715 [Candidatus Saccharimonadales bacterium]|jgi:hypothetical protein